MRILLVRSDFKGEFGEYSAPPLGLAYLAAILEKHSHEVKIFDGWVQNLDIVLPRTINSFSPQLIGLTGLTVDIMRTFKRAEQIKKLAPSIPLIFGGPHATMAPGNTLKNVKAIDIVVLGEGENTIVELVQWARGKRKLSEIDGIAYREKNKIKHTKPRKLIANLDTIPLPARHLLNLKLYRPSPKEHKRLPGTDIITSRGCPYQCAFCFKQVFGSRYRAHSPEYVIKEIKQLVKNYGIKDLFFRDDTFTIEPERVKKICGMMLSEKIDITFTTLARVDRLDYETLKIMKQAGCWKILLGIESGNQKSLDLMKKGITLKQVREAVLNCKKLGIEADGFFMIGIPGETKKDALRTIKFAKSLGLDFAQFYICTPYPGTPLYELSKKSGDLNIKENEWEKFNQYGASKPLFVPYGWTGKELKKFQARAWKSFYLNPSYILRRLRKINSFTELKNHLLGGLKLIDMFGK